MIVKFIGALLLVAGMLVAVPLAWGVAVWLFGSVWTLVKLLFCAGLIWCGWQWLNGRNAPAWRAN